MFSAPIEQFQYKNDGNRYYAQLRAGSEKFKAETQHIREFQVPKYDSFVNNLLRKDYSEYHKWLDVGSCGYPTVFTDFDFTTIEPDEIMTELGQHLFDPAKIQCSDLENFAADCLYDGILFHHSFYCVANPGKTIDKARAILKENGLVIIGIGHFFVDSKVYLSDSIQLLESIFSGETYKVYYTKESLQYLFEKHGFELIQDTLVDHKGYLDNASTRYFVFRKNHGISADEKLLKESSAAFTGYMDEINSIFNIQVRRFFENNSGASTIFTGSEDQYRELLAEGFIPESLRFISLDELRNSPEILNRYDRIYILDIYDYQPALAFLDEAGIYRQQVYVPSSQCRKGPLVFQFGEYRLASFSYSFNPAETHFGRLSRTIREKCPSDDVAVFGTAKAGGLASDLCSRLGFNVVCFIDDYKEGNINGVPVVTREMFGDKYAAVTGAVFKGRMQRGLDAETLCGVRVMEISDDL